ncbi:hypothetical protein I5776_12215 [Heyndrickxia vini]|uniref:Uncharacterized protein n=1 Tax=Heyndrickxia vini TaxID=1476025 RepID=A0ABX7DXS1_9BACI|nr:hypothetical protein I5776_12215 [Heyndrickxia vini]
MIEKYKKRQNKKSQKRLDTSPRLLSFRDTASSCGLSLGPDRHKTRNPRKPFQCLINFIIHDSLKMATFLS